ncbi:MAG: lysophospholipase [Acidimicrobiia bacterium]|nr:lysophospholipase [Acidimicrobiia bacterium]
MSEARRETSRTGVQLATREWMPSGKPRAGILIIHGLAEHSGRYEHVGEQLAGRGFAVQAFDQRGHGESQGDRVHIDAWDIYLDDVEDRLSALKFEVAAPLVMYGHSFGGLVALDYCLSRSEVLPDLLVLSAPAVAASIAKWKQVLAPILAKVVPKASLPLDLEGHQLSRDEAVGKAYFDDPLVETKATAKFGAETLAAQKRVGARMDSLSIRTMVIAGGSDEIVPATSSHGLGEVLGVDRTLYPNLRHEVHNEPEGPEVVGDIADWIDAQLARGERA